MLFASHCHLNAEEFKNDVEAVWARAQEAGVRNALVAGYDLDSSFRAVDLANRLPGIFASVGIHPHDAEDANTIAMREIEGLVREQCVVAVGETGLDFNRGREKQIIQEEAFQAHLDIAQSYNMPAVIHMRDSFREVRSNLEGFRGTGILHCFTGNEEQLRAFLPLDLYISFAGVITYKSGIPVGNSSRGVPRDRLLIETDAPYLAPQSRRRKRNEPANLGETASKLAEKLDRDISEIAETTVQNACRLYSIKIG